MRPEIKTTLNLPQEAANDYLYGSTKFGCCGMTLLAEDSDMTAIDSAFKLLTFPDGRIAREAEIHVREVTKKRISHEPTLGEIGGYLPGQQEGAFRTTRGTGTTSVWSRARLA